MSYPKFTHPSLYVGDRVIVQSRQGRGVWSGTVQYIVDIPPLFPFSSDKNERPIRNVFVEISPEFYEKFFDERERGHVICIRHHTLPAPNLWIISSIDYDKKVVQVRPGYKVCLDEQTTEIAFEDILGLLIWPDGFILVPVHQVELLRPPVPSYTGHKFCDATG